MMTNGAIGTLAALWRFPVKSMRGERLEMATLESNGVVGDRAYALIETETGKVVSAKSVRSFPDLMRCAAEYVEAPRPGEEIPPVRITLPNGASVRSDSGDVDRVLSAHWQRDVTLSRSAPGDYTIDLYRPDIEALTPDGERDVVVDQKLGAALFAERGVNSPVPPGSFFDMYPFSVMTTSTLDRLSELRPESRFDQRRFRMNAIVATGAPGFIENDWVGRSASIGASVRVRIATTDARCVMITRAQDDLPEDAEILRTLVRHNMLRRGDSAPTPCAGVYAEVETPGDLRVGDGVVLG